MASTGDHSTRLDLIKHIRMRIGPYPLTRGEISGAFADLGVLIPLEVGLISINGINPTSTLLGVGVAYVAAGLYFRLPMPVQPLKAFSVIAIAQALSPSVIAAGALLMSVAMFMLAITRSIVYLNRLFPVMVVRGVQFGLGIILVRSALLMWVSKPFLVGGDEQFYVNLAGLDVAYGVVLGIGSLIFLVGLLRWTIFPSAAVVTIGGVLCGLALGGSDAGFAIGPAPMVFVLPGLDDFATALILLVIPQLPLTVTNSVIATVSTAPLYFGTRAMRVTPVRTSLSICLCNLCAGLTGGLPVCHGSGGLTAHYRLGARTPAASIVIATLLIVVAILFGKSAMEVRNLIPFSILGALLFYVGIQHLMLGIKVERRRELAMVALVGVVSVLPFGNLAIGAGVGLLLVLVVRWVSCHRSGANPSAYTIPGGR